MSDLSVRELIMGFATQLRYVKRFGTCRGARMESVAEHSYYCVLYALIVYDWWERQVRIGAMGVEPNEVVDLGEILARAALHDLEECRSGDFPRPFKYSDPDLLRMLNIAADRAMDQVINPWSKDVNLRAAMKARWRLAKDDSLAGRIVQFADALSCISYVTQEAINNNNLVIEDVPGLRGYMAQFKDSKFDFIRPLCDQAIEISDHVLDGVRDRAQL